MEIKDLIKQIITDTSKLFSKKKYLQNMYLMVYQMKKEGINVYVALDNISIARGKTTKRGNNFTYNSTIQSNCERIDQYHDNFFDSFWHFNDAIENNSLLTNDKFLIGIEDNKILLKFSELFPNQKVNGPLNINLEENNIEDETIYIESKTEGGKRIVISIQAERDPQLRKDAINIHGDACKGCGFDFGKTYGEWGKGFIEVHHLQPLGQIKDIKRETDPNKNLTVLCSNCHSMVHRKRGTTLTIEELKDKIANARQ